MASRFSEKIREGFEVWSADGKKLGKVVAIHADDFVVEKGFFFPKDYTLPLDEVRGVRDDSVVLARTQEELGIRGGFWDAFVGIAGPGKIASKENVAPSHSQEHGRTEEKIRTPLHEEEKIRITLHEEQVKATTHTEQVGEVRIHKEVITEERQVTVPVKREVVTVERIAGTGLAEPTTDAGAFEEQSITVPIREGVIDIKKESVVREEIQVTKSSEEVDQPVSTTVRREVAEVERAPEVHRKTGTSG